MKKFKKFWFVLPLTLIAVGLLFVRYPHPLLMPDDPYPILHSPKKHIKEVKRRLVAKDYPLCEDCYDVDITPLYNYKDKFNYLLLDFYPKGFTILKIARTSPISVRRSEYLRPTVFKLYYEEEGKDPIYTSAYKEQDVRDAKLYLLKVTNEHGTGLIPAIKDEDHYINLLTLEEVPLNYYEIDEPYDMYKWWFLYKSIFKL